MEVTPSLIHALREQGSITFVPNEVAEADGIDDIRLSRLPTPESTIDALVYSFRTNGLKALSMAANLERLDRCDNAAFRKIDERLSALEWPDTDLQKIAGVWRPKMKDASHA